MKICTITCYKHPDYIRAKTLRAALDSIDGLEQIVVKNDSRGFKKYLEVIIKTIQVRRRENPDIYLVTFRGYEIFPFIRLITIGKTLWYDEFINPIEWAVFEHHKLPNWKLWRVLYRLLVWPVQKILTDTESHADISAEITGTRRHKFAALPVATDEAVAVSSLAPTDSFRVFFYGTMLPLHGLKVMLDAAKKLRDTPIEFHFVGGGASVATQITKAKQDGARITYQPWLAYDDLMQAAAAANVCLGGPFGGTYQSQFVITGKTYQFLHMKKPVIIGINRETKLFTNQKDCLLIEQNNPDALRNALMWAYQHQDALPAIGESGYRLYQQQLSVARVTDGLRRLLASNKRQLETTSKSQQYNEKYQ